MGDQLDGCINSIGERCAGGLEGYGGNESWGK